MAGYRIDLPYICLDTGHSKVPDIRPDIKIIVNNYPVIT
jgi:hypothetical protein